MEGEGEGGELAAAGISVHSLAVAACGDMAEEKHPKHAIKSTNLRLKCLFTLQSQLKKGLSAFKEPRSGQCRHSW